MVKWEATAETCATGAHANQFPIIVGVTGHCDIDPLKRSEVEQSVRETLTRLRDSLRDRSGASALHLLCAATAGADQLAAGVARDLGIPLVIVAPMPLAEYRETMADDSEALRAFDDFWMRASLRLALPRLTDQSGASSHELQYEQLAIVLSRYSHLLLALWNGVEWSAIEAAGLAGKYRGGTAQAVYLRQLGEESAPAFTLSPLFPRETSLLDLTFSGPIFHIATPCTKREIELPLGALSSVDAGRLRVWDYKRPQRERPVPSSLDDALCGWRNLPPVSAPQSITFPEHHPEKQNPILGERSRAKQATEREHTFEKAEKDSVSDADERDYISKKFCRDLSAIIELNDSIADAVRTDSEGVERHVSFIRPARGDVLDPETLADIEHLRRLQAIADMAAQQFQRRLIGAHRIFAVTLPASIIVLGLYAHLYPSLPLALLYFAIFGGAWCYYHFKVQPLRWQEKFQDYRAIAEAMRVQVFWSLAAMPWAVCDHYLRKHFDELGWIQQALRGPALWAAAAALRLAAPQDEIIGECWLRNQRDWFIGPAGNAGKRLLNEQARDVHKRKAGECFLAGMTVTFLLVVWQVLGDAASHYELVQRQMIWLATSASAITDYVGIHTDGRAHADAATPIELVRGLLIILSTSAFGVAGYHGVRLEQLSFEAQAHAYARMGRLFNKALAEVKKPNLAPNGNGYRAIISELGREALSENADWLIDHRRRPIANPQHGV